ncbi:MAG TPA: carbonic anhydrase [Chloroflexota bacterium]|nr:carbonic anhydrase [Chloroflexota bacterium]
MRKLIKGIVDFRQHVRPDYKETFARLALGQAPDCLFIACSDSRVVPHLFASTEPGDLFVTRNVGNLVPPCGPDGIVDGDEAEAAAIEYAVLTLRVRDIIVCGHSACGAMRAILDGAGNALDADGTQNANRTVSTAGPSTSAASAAPYLTRWLRHGVPALEKLQAGRRLNPDLPPHDILSQLNVLEQMAHVASYPAVAERARAGTLGIHGWWFDIAGADVYAYEPALDRFVVIDEEEAERLLASLPDA